MGARRRERGKGREEEAKRGRSRCWIGHGACELRLETVGRPGAWILKRSGSEARNTGMCIHFALCASDGRLIGTELTRPAAPWWSTGMAPDVSDEGLAADAQDAGLTAAVAPKDQVEAQQNGQNTERGQDVAAQMDINSTDGLRALTRREGTDARNVISWRVPNSPPPMGLRTDCLLLTPIPSLPLRISCACSHIPSRPSFSPPSRPFSLLRSRLRAQVKDSISPSLNAQNAKPCLML